MKKKAIWHHLGKLSLLLKEMAGSKKIFGGTKNSTSQKLTNKKLSKVGLFCAKLWRLKVNKSKIGMHHLELEISGVWVKIKRYLLFLK